MGVFGGTYFSKPKYQIKYIKGVKLGCCWGEPRFLFISRWRIKSNCLDTLKSDTNFRMIMPNFPYKVFMVSRIKSKKSIPIQMNKTWKEDKIYDTGMDMQSSKNRGKRACIWVHACIHLRPVLQSNLILQNLPIIKMTSNFNLIICNVCSFWIFLLVKWHWICNELFLEEVYVPMVIKSTSF